MSVFRISRLNIVRNCRHPAILANYSDDASKKGGPPEKIDSADKKKKQDQKADDKKEVTSKRLNDLLAMMSSDSDLSIVKEVIKPRSAAEKKERKKTLSAADEKVDGNTEATKSENLAEAAKKVAESIGGDTKKTESELLALLLKTGDAMQEKNLTSLIGGMEVDTDTSPPFHRRSDIVRKTQKPFRETNEHEGKFQDQPPRRDRKDQKPFRRTFEPDGRFQDQRQTVRKSVDLFGGKPLGIFTNTSEIQESPDILPTWNYLHNRELKLAVTHPPKNYFEKMAIWTEQGKLWKFPIDNEQGMDDEAKNYFTEHIFLEKHLESWCPTKGPIRHFMELVCVGLSKNPYYTVTQKREHIEWFRDYFAAKKELLDSVIVDSDTQKQLQP